MTILITNYCKIITNYNKNLLQITTVLLQNTTVGDYKLRQLYYKLQQMLLQITAGITNYDVITSYVLTNVTEEKHFKIKLQRLQKI